MGIITGSPNKALASILLVPGNSKMAYPYSITLSNPKSPSQNGTELLAAYARAKAMTPNGSALSATNRVVVWLPPGEYLLASTLELDADFVDIRSMVPIDTGFRGPSLSQTAPSGFSTKITCAGGGKPTIIQTADDVRLHGFCVENTGSTDGATMETSDCGLVLQCGSNGDDNVSFYDTMYFLQPNSQQTVGDTPYGHVGVCAASGYSIGGTWTNCVTTNHGWRLVHNSSKSTSMKLFGNFYRCHAGYRGFAGDPQPTATSFPGITGHFVDCSAGTEGFAGCSYAGCSIESTARLYRCVAGPSSFAKGGLLDGQLFDCIGGDESFAGAHEQYISNGLLGQIGTNARLVRCICTGSGFGTQMSISKYRTVQNGANSAHRAGGILGTLIDCECLAMTKAMYLNGGSIRGGYFNQTGTDEPCVRVGEDGGTIIGATLIGNGTSDSIVSHHNAIFCGQGGSVSGTRFYSGDSQNTLTYQIPVKAGTVVIDFKSGDVWYQVTDDGAGNLTGDVNGGGTNTINYATGEVDVTFSAQPQSGWTAWTNYELDLTSGAGQPAVAQCSTNLGFSSNVSSSVTTPNNVVDAAIS